MGKGQGRCNSRSGTKDPRRQEGDTRRAIPVSATATATATTVVSGKGSGRRLQLGCSRLFGVYWRSLLELSGEPAAVVAAAPGAAAVTLHPAPQWIPSRTTGRRLHQAQVAPHSLEKRRSRAKTLGTLGERWLSRPEVVGQYPDGVSQSAVGRRRPGRRLLTPGTSLIPPCFGEVGA